MRQRYVNLKNDFYIQENTIFIKNFDKLDVCTLKKYLFRQREITTYNSVKSMIHNQSETCYLYCQSTGTSFSSIHINVLTCASTRDLIVWTWDLHLRSLLLLWLNSEQENTIFIKTKIILTSSFL